MDGKIVSAYPLDEATVKTIAEKFSARMGAPVVLKQEVDPSIVAGFIVTIGYHRFDFSAKARLKEMMRHMLNN
jgi:F-type H+-transporting ATPase subunit delta